jgi:DHA1 family tetracycline resistance protein-like MFS transporter
MFLWFVANQSLQGLWSFYSGWRYDWSPQQVGWSLSAVGVGAILVQGLVIRRFVARFGETAAASTGIVFGAVAFLLYGLAVDWRVGALGIVFGALGGLAYPSMQALLSRLAPANAQGETQGAVAAISSMSVIVGPPLMTHLFSLTAHDRTSLAAGLPYYLAAVLALATLFLVRRGARAAKAEVPA